MNYKREPVAIVGAVVLAIEAFFPMMVALGYIDWDKSQIGYVMAFIAALGTIATVIISRRYVTPLSDPRDYEGRMLVPEDNDK